MCVYSNIKLPAINTCKSPSKTKNPRITYFFNVSLVVRYCKIKIEQAKIKL